MLKNLWKIIRASLYVVMLGFIMMLSRAALLLQKTSGDTQFGFHCNSTRASAGFKLRFAMDHKGAEPCRAVDHYQAGCNTQRS